MWDHDVFRIAKREDWSSGRAAMPRKQQQPPRAGESYMPSLNEHSDVFSAALRWSKTMSAGCCRALASHGYMRLIDLSVGGPNCLTVNWMPDDLLHNSEEATSRCQGALALCSKNFSETEDPIQIWLCWHAGASGPVSSLDETTSLCFASELKTELNYTPPVSSKASEPRLCNPSTLMLRVPFFWVAL